MGGCFPCFGSSDEEKKVKNGVKGGKEGRKDARKERSVSVSKVSLDKSKSGGGSDSKKEASIPKDGSNAHIAAQTFSFKELAAATKNFSQECLLGEGGFGRVYKGRLESTGQNNKGDHGHANWTNVKIVLK